MMLAISKQAMKISHQSINNKITTSQQSNHIQ